MNDLFICYSREDRDFVDYLSKELDRNGWSVWYDRQVAPSKIWRHEITDNLRRSRVVLVVLSQSALRSHWVGVESALGYSLGKQMLVLNMSSELVPIQEVPDYLRTVQMFTYEDSSSTNELMNRIAEMGLRHTFLADLCDGGLDICVPKEDFDKNIDRRVTKIEGVNLRAINVALGLQRQLLQRFGPTIQNTDPIKMRFVADDEVTLPVRRNYIVLGGAGGVPFVRTLLTQWTGYTHALDSGYRLVTAKGRYFKPSPFLRIGDDRRTGVEDVQGGRVVRFFEYRHPQEGIDGQNYVIVYTKGLNEPLRSTDKYIVLAAFNRDALEGAVQFLLNQQLSSDWIGLVQQCGTYSETLLRFRVNIGASPTYLDYEGPRRLGQ